jgi:hypothetical protein
MELVGKIDDYGKPAWIGVMVLGFIVFWPIGLVTLAYLIWSGRMGCWKHGGPGRWHFEGVDRERSGGKGRRRKHRREAASSGNHAFDEYREETLRRLEDEQSEFEGFLERLRHAKDKAEFDQFMDERRRQPEGHDPSPGAADDPGPQPNA